MDVDNFQAREIWACLYAEEKEKAEKKRKGEYARGEAVNEAILKKMGGDWNETQTIGKKDGSRVSKFEGWIRKQNFSKMEFLFEVSISLWRKIRVAHGKMIF